MYFDNNSTTAIDPRVLSRLRDDLELYANPSTSYRIGREARALIDEARSACKSMLGAPYMVFVSSASEANNLVIRGRLAAGDHVLMSAIEHPSVYNTVRSLHELHQCTFDVVPVDGDGLLDLRALKWLLERRPDTRIVCVIRSNNETGVIQKMTDIRDLCHSYGVHLHVDATQCIGKIPFEMEGDTAVVSAHKFRGPKGIAALLFRNHDSIRPMCTGGKQEFGLRAGTESVAMIRAFEAALRIAIAVDTTSMQNLRDDIEDAMETLGCTINSRDVPRLPNTISAILPRHVDGRALMAYLDERNIYVNVGSACAQGGASGTLRGMGLTPQEEARTIRISLGPSNTTVEATTLVESIAEFISSHV